MARMADRILAGLRVLPPWMMGGDYLKRAIEELLPGIPIIITDNVMRYYMAGSPKDDWSIWDDFPNVAPPFELFWMEARPGSLKNRGGIITKEPHGVKCVGFLCAGEKRDPGGWMLHGTAFQTGEKGVLGVRFSRAQAEEWVQAMERDDGNVGSSAAELLGMSNLEVRKYRTG